VRRVTKGWDKRHCADESGGKRTHHPTATGYGERGAGGVIPPNATLIFEVELVSMK